MSASKQFMGQCQHLLIIEEFSNLENIQGYLRNISSHPGQAIMLVFCWQVCTQLVYDFDRFLAIWYKIEAMFDEAKGVSVNNSKNRSWTAEPQ